MVDEESCEACDDSGFEVGTDPPLFCTFCAKGLQVAQVQRMQRDEEERRRLMAEYSISEEMVSDYMTQFGSVPSESEESK
jgi:hypothetical protein